MIDVTRISSAEKHWGVGFERTLGVNIMHSTSTMRIILCEKKEDVEERI